MTQAQVLVLVSVLTVSLWLDILLIVEFVEIAEVSCEIDGGGEAA